MNLSFNAAIDQLPVESAREALRILRAPHFNPVFGATKTVEHEVAAFSALQLLGFLNTPTEPFELITKLRVVKIGVSIGSVGGLVQGLVLKFGEKLADETGSTLGKEVVLWLKKFFVPAKSDL